MRMRLTLPSHHARFGGDAPRTKTARAEARGSLGRSCARACVGLMVVLGVDVAAAAPTDLDVSRVAIFSSGVAFFECEGEVEGDAVVELKFRTDQINDILKSLVVQDFDGGSVNVVSYASRDPVEKTLQSFAVNITGKPTLGQLLDQLRGEPVSIAGPRKLDGVIVGVETVQVMRENTVVEQQLLNVLSDSGMQTLPIHELTGIKLTNQAIAKELHAALTTLAAGRDADKKAVAIHFDGQGSRHVRVMYLLEAPIWKTSYRLVLRAEDKPYLQGWATVENATEEDWNDARLSLVSGRPISFRMDLYTPLYVPRPVEELEIYASLRPPEFAGAFADVDQDGAVDHEEMPASKATRGRGKLPPPSSRKSPESYGSMAFVPGRSSGAMAGDALERFAGAGVASLAEAADAGELFQYALSQPISLARQHSAMLPIVTQEIDAEKVSIYKRQRSRQAPDEWLATDQQHRAEPDAGANHGIRRRHVRRRRQAARLAGG